jgi:S-(hydroxymethyl)glutathione dehydrogenase/alcohol dehydrogenase
MARVEGSVTIVGMPPVGSEIRLPALAATFSGKRLQGSAVGGSQILRDFPRYIRLAETGQLDLASMVTNRITLDQVNEGIASLDRAEGTRTVIVG